MKLASRRARATAGGVPYDPVRIERFERLATHLLASGLPELSESSHHDVSVFAFFESYFSNYIEGTEFTVKEAANIVFRGAMPAQRPKDAHDVLGTYRLVVDPSERRRVPTDADELLSILRDQHATMLAERPDIGPGQWKERNNHVGGREFVDWHLVEGTLREAYRFYQSLPAGFARAAFAMFLVAEVHPFADGNGRTARLLMNSELSAARQQRIVVTTRDCGDYLAGLRGMTNDLNVTGFRQGAGRSAAAHARNRLLVARGGGGQPGTHEGVPRARRVRGRRRALRGRRLAPGAASSARSTTPSPSTASPQSSSPRTSRDRPTRSSRGRAPTRDTTPCAPTSATGSADGTRWSRTWRS